MIPPSHPFLNLSPKMSRSKPPHHPWAYRLVGANKAAGFPYRLLECETERLQGLQAQTSLQGVKQCSSFAFKAGLEAWPPWPLGNSLCTRKGNSLYSVVEIVDLLSLKASLIACPHRR